MFGAPAAANPPHPRQPSSFALQSLDRRASFVARVGTPCRQRDKEYNPRRDPMNVSKAHMMNAKQRVGAILDRRPVDRIPVELWVTPEVRDALYNHTGTNTELDLWRALEIDKIIWINPTYKGALRPVTQPGFSANIWGCLLSPVQAGRSEYMENVDHPLATLATPDELKAYKWWPDPDQFDYDDMQRQIEAVTAAGFASIGPWVSFFEIYCAMRGLEQSLYDLGENPEFVEAALDRIEEIQTTMLKRFFARAATMLDLLCISDDMGTQQSTFMSARMWKQHFGPRLKRWCDLANSSGVKAFYHSDGAVAPLIPGLIEAGIDVLNPIQHVCPGMGMSGLKAKYGDQVVFHGAVDTQRALPFGTPEEVRAETLACLETLGAGRSGYICASCHNIQAGTPVENILTMIRTVHQQGAL